MPAPPDNPVAPGSPALAACGGDCSGAKTTCAKVTWLGLLLKGRQGDQKAIAGSSGRPEERNARFGQQRIMLRRIFFRISRPGVRQAVAPGSTRSPSDRERG